MAHVELLRNVLGENGRIHAAGEKIQLADEHVEQLVEEGAVKLLGRIESAVRGRGRRAAADDADDATPQE